MYRATLLIITLCVLASVTEQQERIIGGHEVDIARHPYLVSIRLRSTKDSPYLHFCGGTIYNERTVITAAQCVVDISGRERVIVVAGANTRTGADGMQYPVSKCFHNANYSFWTIDYDVGMLIVDEPFDFARSGLRSITIRPQRPAVGKMATIPGWGYREEFGPSSYQLEETQVPIVSQEDCNTVYGVGEVTERMICAGYLRAGGKDACQGDTGGPMVVEGELVGLVSWGRGCARPGYPGVYTFVGSVKEWIDNMVAANIQ